MAQMQLALGGWTDALTRRVAAVFAAPLPLWATVFTRAYLLALLIHYGKRWTEPEITVLLLILALWTLVRPRQIVGFLIANLALVVNDLAWFPRIANHASLALFIGIFVLVLAVGAFLAARPLPWAALANGLRGLAVVLYFYVGFHKINEGFLDPQASCATWYHEKFLASAFGYQGPIPHWILVVSPWLVIGFELVACVLLLFPRTWLLGLVVALPIHLYVSLSGFTDFSALMHAVMLLFLPLAFWTRLETDTAARRLLERSLVVYAVVVVVLVVVRYYGLFYWGWDIETLMTLQGLLYDLAVLELIAVIGWLLWRNPAMRAAPLFRWPGWRHVHIVLPLLVFVWGAFPYLFGSQGSLTMFSNLVTARSYQNHLLLDTRWTKIVDLEEDLVRVVWMDPLGARDFRYDLTGDLIPRYELAYTAWVWKQRGVGPVPAALEETGRVVVYDDLTRSALAAYDPVARWFSFRQIEPVGVAPCRW